VRLHLLKTTPLPLIVYDITYTHYD
jgi:hypothetical protein